MVINRVRVRGLLTAAIALVPLLLAACNKGGSSGY
jgi:predicted small secreted protein